MSITPRTRPASRPGRLLGLWLVLGVVAATTTASSSSSSSSRHLRTQVFHSTSRRHHAKRRRRPTTDNSKKNKGTQVHWNRPTPSRLAQWFGYDDDNPDNEFNHDAVGLTNPCLHVAVPPTSQNGVDQIQQVTSLTTASSTDDGGWWPSSLCPHKNHPWRVLRFRTQVGTGRDCYEAVRDAALKWDFHDDENGKGMMSLCKSSSSHQHPQSRERLEERGTGYQVVHTASYGDGDLQAAGDDVLTVGGRRRMVTYTPVLQQRLVFVVNPVEVVYNVLDQRGPATTYSSTAYATQKGHWLRGEERVTVALRDDTGSVQVEILSYSQSAPTLWGRLIWPLVGPMQQNFFTSQMKALERVAHSTTTTTMPPLLPRDPNNLVIEAALQREDVWMNRR